MAETVARFGGRAGRILLSLILAFSCVPALSSAGAGEAFAEEDAATTANAEIDLSSLSAGDVFQASVDGLDIYFTVLDEDSVAVGRGNSAGGEDLAIDADFEGAVVIPDQVSDGSTTLSVTEIQSYAFGEGSVIVKGDDGSSSVEYLGCALGSVSIPATVESIDSYAFCGCASLATVDFAEDGALQSIGVSAFNHCVALQAADIPASVVEIERYAFAFCPSMSELSFAEDAAIETIGRSAFAGSESLPGSIESVEFPAVESIASSVMSYQVELEELSFAGESYQMIGSSAFANCSSLTSVVMPRLTGGSNNDDCELEDNCFANCTSLTTVVFMDDAGDYEVASMGIFAGCSALSSVVFMGSKCELEFDSEDTHAFYNVSFYESESDAEAGEDCLGSARIRDDASYGEIKNGEVDEEQIYDDGGSIPAASGAWAFEGLPMDEDLIEDSCWAYDASETLFASCTVTMAETSYICRGSPVELDYSVTSASGEELEEGVDYTTTIYLDGEERSADELDEAGDYTILFEGVGDYVGSTERSFSIAWASVDWALVSGQNSRCLAKATSRATTTSGEGDELIFLVGEDEAEYALACLGVAGLKDAVIAVTAQDELSEEAAYQLRRTGANGVVVVGDYDAIAEDVDLELNDFSTGPSVSRLGVDDLADAAATIYEKFADEGLGADGCAYVVASDDATLAAAVGTEAYENARPIFFSDSEGQLDGSTRSALKTGDFDTVVVLADSRSAAATIEETVGNDDIDFQVVVGSASEISADVAAEQVAALDLDEDDFDLVVGTSADGGDAALAALYAARKGSILVLAQDEDEAAEVVETSIGEDWGELDSLRFVGRRAQLPQEVVDEVLYSWYGGYTRFSDVSVSSWYAEYVVEAVDQELVEGYSDESGEATGEYGPNDKVTRAQVATILYRASDAGSMRSEDFGYETDTVFSDEASGVWYTAAINWCSRNGVLYGDGDGKVRPNDTVTREELACMLMRYADRMGYDVDEDALPQIEGVDGVDEVSSWADVAMRWVFCEDILEGEATSSGAYLDAQGVATRAQIAKLCVLIDAMTCDIS